MNNDFAKRIVEAALLSASQPLGLPDLQRLFDPALPAGVLRSLLDELQTEWQGRGLELAALASGWRFQTRAQLRPYLERLHPEKPPKYSRAVLETLAIIAYRQPVTRGDIEELRGVAVNAETLRRLEERGWIETIGHREAPGRPALLATTRQFLDDLGLQSLQQLPTLSEAGSQAGDDAIEALAPMLPGLDALPDPPAAPLAAVPPASSVELHSAPAPHDDAALAP
jgi:segregation and condensation protein B